MEITWFGQSCFRLRSAQATVLTDPFDLAQASADVVTLSDRGARPRVLASAARLVDGPGEYEIKGVPITGIATANGSGADGSPRNFVYTMVMDGIAVCHLGRLTRAPSAQQIQEIGLPDVVIIPLGEPAGLTATRAAQLASQLEAKLMVPMTLGGPNDRATLEAFCKELGADPNAVGSRLTVTATALASQTRVVVLTPEAAE